MGTKIERGFTVIEVMLFLGVSAMLLVGILVATGSTVSDARFTDSMKGVESFVQRQYDEVVNGVNPRTASQGCTAVTPTSPGTSTCLLLGKVIVFGASNPNIVGTYYVVGTDTIPAGSNLTTSAALTLLTLQTTQGGQEPFELPWGAQFVQGKRTKAPQTANAIAYLRNPTSSQIQAYVFRANVSSGAVTNLEQTFNAPGLLIAATDNSVSFCMRGADGMTNQYQGALSISQGLGASTISAKRLTGAEWSSLC